MYITFMMMFDEESNEWTGEVKGKQVTFYTAL